MTNDNDWTIVPSIRRGGRGKPHAEWMTCEMLTTTKNGMRLNDAAASMIGLQGESTVLCFMTRPVARVHRQDAGGPETETQIALKVAVTDFEQMHGVSISRESNGDWTSASNKSVFETLGRARCYKLIARGSVFQLQDAGRNLIVSPSKEEKDAADAVEAAKNWHGRPDQGIPRMQ